jgi:hypothetical protein
MPFLRQKEILSEMLVIMLDTRLSLALHCSPVNETSPINWTNDKQKDKRMQEKTRTQKPVVIRRMKVDRWVGISDASKIMGRSIAQIKRHLDGRQPSRKLQADMDRLGVVVER